MAINQLKIVLSILKEISEDTIPNASDYEIEPQKFYDILEAMQEDILIKNAKLTRGGIGNKVILHSLTNVKITIRGMEYLSENSTLMKTYKGLKEIREWLPF